MSIKSSRGEFKTPEKEKSGSKVSIKRSLYEQYKDQDFIGYSVEMYMDESKDRMVVSSKPFEVFLNKGEYIYRKKENMEQQYRIGGKFIFCIVKDVVDSETPEKNRVFQPPVSAYDCMVAYN